MRSFRVDPSPDLISLHPAFTSAAELSAAFGLTPTHGRGLGLNVKIFLLCGLPMCSAEILKRLSSSLSLLFAAGRRTTAFTPRELAVGESFGGVIGTAR